MVVMLRYPITTVKKAEQYTSLVIHEYLHKGYGCWPETLTSRHIALNQELPPKGHQGGLCIYQGTEEKDEFSSFNISK